MRNTNGQFLKGHHWRKPKPHWSFQWLEREYLAKQRSAAEIAEEVGCKENNIHYWLHKHGIRTRTAAQVRAVKHWGVSGPDNPMFGRCGKQNPRYVDGSSPERQTAMAGHSGKQFRAAVLSRDNYSCVRCGKGKAGPRSLHVHHLKAWAGNPTLRFNPENAVTLCRGCHNWVHSRKNTEREYLAA